MKKKNKKGQLGIYIVFMILAIVLITITGLLAPMGILFTTKMYQAGENILLDSQDQINLIQNTTVRNRIYSIVDEAEQAAETNIEINSDLFQYAWVFILVILAIVVFLLARQTVEFGGLI